MTSKIIEDIISDLIADITNGETSVNEIVELFRYKLEEGIGQ